MLFFTRTFTPTSLTPEAVRAPPTDPVPWAAYQLYGPGIGCYNFNQRFEPVITIGYLQSGTI